MLLLVGGVSPSRRSKTAIAGTLSLPTNFGVLVAATVDSAVCGRNAALSFSWTVASFPANEPERPADEQPQQHDHRGQDPAT